MRTPRRPIRSSVRPLSISDDILRISWMSNVFKSRIRRWSNQGRARYAIWREEDEKIPRTHKVRSPRYRSATHFIAWLVELGNIAGLWSCSSYFEHSWYFSIPQNIFYITVKSAWNLLRQKLNQEADWTIINRQILWSLHCKMDLAKNLNHYPVIH